MRLTVEQQQQILQLVRGHLGTDTTVRVYGSRLDDRRRGGDIDLMIEGRQHLAPLARAGLQLDLEQAVGYPVDILYHQLGQSLTAFQELARASSQALPDRRA